MLQYNYNKFILIFLFQWNLINGFYNPTLTQPRSRFTATTIYDISFFAGGCIEGIYCKNYSNHIDIYNYSSNSWFTTTLSQPRYRLTSTTVGNLALFVGGYNFNGSSNVVDIYNYLSNSWNTTTISQARGWLAATTIYNLSIFAGGMSNNNNPVYYNDIDIYNYTSNNWSTTTLSISRSFLTATTVGNLAMFAGGHNTNGVLNTVDIYNYSSNNWITNTLSMARFALTSTTIGNLAIFAGGSNGYNPISQVDIYNHSSNTWTTTTLSMPRADLAATSVGNLAIFAGGDYGGGTYGLFNNIDIFDSISNLWTTAVLSKPRSQLVATTNHNLAFFAGGYSVVNGTIDSSQIDIYNNNSKLWIPTCPVGTYLNYLGQFITCPPCPIGTFYSNITEICTPCPLGTFSNINESLSRNSCIPCSTINSTTNNNIPNECKNHTNILFNTGINNYFEMIPIGLQDINWKYIGFYSTNNSDDCQNWIHPPSNSTLINDFAFILLPNQQWYLPPSNTSWIGPNITSSIQGNYPGCYWYRSNFNISSTCLNNITLSTIISVDNILWLYINENYIGTISALSHSSTIPIPSKNLKIGLNEVIVVVFNEDGYFLPSSRNPTGFFIKWNYDIPLMECISGTETNLAKIIAPIVVIFIFMIIIIIIIGIYVYKKKKRQFLREELEMVHFEEYCNEIKNIEIKEKLGGGNFGEVYKGIWNGTTEVALKKLKSKEYLKHFIHEAKVIKLLKHPNIVQFFGIYNNSVGEQYIVMEYLSKGSLDKMLKNQGHLLTITDLLMISRHTIKGMEYLEEKTIIHRDLASRNLLVGPGSSEYEKYIIKITDFGLSRIMEKDYYRTSDTTIPIRWSAPEVLEKGIYSSKSDVWSFGIVLWEIFTFGNIPYSGMSNLEVAEKVISGYILEKPKNCPNEIYELMLKCWKYQSEERPSFKEIFIIFEEFTQKYQWKQTTMPVNQSNKNNLNNLDHYSNFRK